MLEMIHVIIFLAWLIAIAGFISKDYAITLIGSIFIMVLGVYIVANGITDINNWLTEAIGAIHIGIGGYIFIRGAWEGFKIY
jgi:hypothetical protein